MSKHILFAIITGIGLYLFGVLSSEQARAYEGPKVSSGNLPNKHIYAACTDGSPTDFFTNTEAETFVITDLWMASQVAGSNSSARIYMDGQPLVRISAQQQAISLNSRTGIAVLNGQTLSCDRLSSYGTEVTIIGYYAHTP